MLRYKGDLEEDSASEYRRRYWNYEEVPWLEKNASKYKICSPRRDGDRHTGEITLEASNVDQLRTPDYILEHAEFGFRVPHHKRNLERWVRQIVKHFRITAPACKACVLQYEYFYAAYGQATCFPTTIDQYNSSN